MTHTDHTDETTKDTVLTLYHLTLSDMMLTSEGAGMVLLFPPLLWF